MKKLVYSLVTLLSFPLWAQEITPALVTEAEVAPKHFNMRRGHWLTSFGFETLKYDTPFEYSGARKSFIPDDQELWGGRLGIGRAFHLGAGILTSTRLEGYYMGTLFSKARIADPDAPSVEFASTKEVGQVYGGDIVQTLGFTFEMKTKNPILEEWSYLTVEPFIEAGVGVARAYNRLNYVFNTGASGTDEAYRQSFSDEITNSRIGLGVNFTSNIGYFLYLRATQNRFNVTKRETSGIRKANQQAAVSFSSSDTNVDMDPVMIYAVGGGYRF